MVASYETRRVLSFEAVHKSVVYKWEEIFLFLVTKGNLIRLFFTRSKFNLWRQIGDKIDHYISCRRNFLIPWKIALRVVVFHSSCRRVLRFVVI